jgi:GAF domain/PilZ domain
MIPERRSCVRHKVHGPVFASFDGVTGGFILDLSEEGMAMQTVAPVEAHRRVQLGMNLPEADYLETTGYVAWADALGRAGVRFSELPEEARLRLDRWLAHNSGSPSHRAPKFTLSDPVSSLHKTDLAEDPARQGWAITLEPEMHASGVSHDQRGLTVEYEFRPLGSDLPAMLRLIGERARSLTRGTSAVIALGRYGFFRCRASVGASAPALGAYLDVNSGLSGECVRTGKALRCDDTEADPRVEVASCRRLGIRSIVAAPIQYEREIVGLREVLSNRPYAFEEGDVALVERLAQTILMTISQMDAL